MSHHCQHPSEGLSSQGGSFSSRPDPALSSLGRGGPLRPSTQLRQSNFAAYFPPPGLPGQASGSLALSPVDNLVHRLMSAIGPILAEYQQVTSQRLAQLESSIQDLSRQVATSSNDTHDQNKQVAMYLERTLSVQQATTNALASRVDKLEKLIGKSSLGGGGKSFMNDLDGIEPAIEELSERARDPRVSVQPVVRHDVRVSPMNQPQECSDVGVDPRTPMQHSKAIDSPRHRDASSDSSTAVGDGSEGGHHNPVKPKPHIDPRDDAFTRLASIFSSVPSPTNTLSPANWSTSGTKSSENSIQSKERLDIINPNTSPEAIAPFTLIPQTRTVSPEGTVADLRFLALGDPTAGPASSTPSVPAPFHSCPSVSQIPSPASSPPSSPVQFHISSPPPVTTLSTATDLDHYMLQNALLSYPAEPASPRTIASPEHVQPPLLPANLMARPPLQLLVRTYETHERSISLSPQDNSPVPSTTTGSLLKEEESVSNMVMQKPTFCEGSLSPLSSLPSSSLSSPTPTSTPSTVTEILPSVEEPVDRRVNIRPTDNTPSTLTQTYLRPKISGLGRSIAATRIKKRKAKAEERAPMTIEPPAKRARRRSNNEASSQVHAQSISASGSIKRPRKSKMKAKGVKWPKMLEEGNEGFLRTFIQCDSCQLWFHYCCVGIVPGDTRIEPGEMFACPPCISPLNHQPPRNARGKEYECSRPDCKQNCSADEFFVERIVGRKPDGTGRGYLYLVKWDTYPFDMCTWEAEPQLLDPQTLVAEFIEAAMQEGLDLGIDEVVILKEAVDGGCTTSMRA